MLFSVTKMKTLGTVSHLIPPGQKKKLLHATHAYVFTWKLENSRYTSLLRVALVHDHCLAFLSSTGKYWHYDISILP